jgi:outer membrane protein assembly factor BamA
LNKALFRIFYLIISFYFSVNPAYAQSASDSYFISEIVIQGNEKTNKSIVLREICFNANTYVPRESLQQLIEDSKNNLLNTSLFHDVAINFLTKDNSISVNVILRERWYTWIWPLLEHPDRNINIWWDRKDFSRLSAGLNFQQENFRGRREQVNIKALAGYRNFINVVYEVPFFNKNQTWGFNISTMLSNQKEINYITTGNSQKSFSSTKPLLKHKKIELTAVYRPRLHFSHLFSFGFINLEFHDTLQILNKDFYGTINSPSFLSFNYLIKIDYRQQRAYPTDGMYLESTFSLLKQNNSAYSQASNRNSIRGYYSMNKLLFASEIAVKFTFPNQKLYFLQNALGFDRDYIRGYEYMVIEGPHYFIGKYNVRYALMEKKYLNLPLIRSSKFNKIPISIYVGPHLDIGKTWPSLDDKSNTLQNQFLTGYGLGLDLITYYDKVLRIEYTISDRHTSGFFIHFMAAI